jgi:hypothetical protein
VTRTFYGTFDPASPEWPVPLVRAHLYVPGITTTWQIAEFLLDTGASSTILHPAQAVAVGFTLDQLQTPQPWDREAVSGVGGDVTNYVLPAGYGFVFPDASTKVLRGAIRVAPLTPESARLPSLLGWDVLQYFRVVTDWAVREVSLTEHD